MPLVSGYRYATWNTAGLAPGKYYLAGYLKANGASTYSHLTTQITITAAALMVDDSLALGECSVVDRRATPTYRRRSRAAPAAATGIQVASTLAGLSVRIVDLPGNMLGESAGNTIYVDRNAAGYGWFVDPTPGDDREFAVSLGPYALRPERTPLPPAASIYSQR